MGVNYQINSFVLGVEGDFYGSWVKGTALDPLGDALQTQVLWTGTITGRLGWAFDRLLVYGKGGAAFDYDRDTVSQPSGVVVVGSTTRAGWTVGGGLEYAVTEHWTTRIEYDYLKFPAKGRLHGARCRYTRSTRAERSPSTSVRSSSLSLTSLRARHLLAPDAVLAHHLDQHALACPRSATAAAGTESAADRFQKAQPASTIGAPAADAGIGGAPS